MGLVLSKRDNHGCSGFDALVSPVSLTLAEPKSISSPRPQQWSQGQGRRHYRPLAEYGPNEKRRHRLHPPSSTAPQR